MVRVGLWGTFDVEHLGDALFPRLLGAELARRVPGLELVPASPLGYVGLNRFELDEPAAPLGAWSEERVAELAADLDALVIGGGEIVHGDDARLAPWYGLPAEVLVRRAPSRFFVEGLGKHEVDVPVVWWAVGVADADGADLAPALAERWRCAAAGRAAIVARDEPSRAALVAAGVGVRIDVVPDIALTAPRAFSAEASAVRIEHLRRRGVFPDGDALVVQGGAASLPHVDAIAAQVREICAGRGLTPVVVETEPVHGDGASADAIAAALPEARRLPSDAGVEDVVAAIAWSAGAVGDSRTLAALAAAFGRGGATVDVDARASRVDVAERLGLGARPVRDPGRIAATFDASAAHGSVEAARDDLDAQLDRLAAILTSAEVRPHDPPPVVAGSTLADERKRYALASRALVARMAATQRAFALREAELRAYGDAVHRELVERDIRFTKLWRRLHEADRHYHFHIHRADEAELRIEHLEREIEFLRGQRVRPWLRRRVALFLWWLRPTPVGRALAAARARLRERR